MWQLETWERGEAINLWKEMKVSSPGTGPADVRLIFFSDSKYLETKVECFAKWGD